MGRVLDREPRDRAGWRAAAHEIERQLRGETVGRARFEHAVGRQRRVAEQRGERHRAERHRPPVGDIARHVDGGRIGAREQRLAGEGTRRAVGVEFERGLGRRALPEQANRQQHEQKPLALQHSFSGKGRSGGGRRRDAAADGRNRATV